MAFRRVAMKTTLRRVHKRPMAKKHGSARKVFREKSRRKQSHVGFRGKRRASGSEEAAFFRRVPTHTHANQHHTVRLLHLSDTHDLQNEIERRFPLPDADILLHTGDLTENGSSRQLHEVNAWFGRIKHRFKHIVVIAGNHDLSSASWCERADLKSILTNATVLNHEVCREVLEEFGMQIYGSPWLASKSGDDPGGRGHLFHKIPPGIDVLMTHGPARNILDSIDKSKHSWGSSQDLNDAIMRARPRVHLFGHLHEQRGFWQRNSAGRYEGGVEFKDDKGKTFPTKGPPPHNWPCDVVSCNAMANHPEHDRKRKHIAGPARLIVAKRSSAHPQWQFAVRAV